ncbi:MAG: 4-hydroxybenzoate octaprenyltransferase [Clostridia bacterium]|nr:4-hydroxybenzoate octaprenyltransferase [Clostridia bacterium]
MKLAGKVLKKLRDYGKLVMFSHTVFSLSFAAVAFLVASGGKIDLRVAFWAAVAFLSARTGANALNRAVDAKIDAKNPRTAGRQIPKGEVSVAETVIFTAVCFAVMVLAAWQLNPLCAILSPAALFLMTIYSYTKRFTWLCHLVLGVTCACAPAGAWIAVTGRISPEVIVLGGANALWTAGFDIIYGAQDYDFDTANGIHSIPARFGVRNGLRISTLFHVGALFFLAAFGLMAAPPLGWLYAAALAVIAVLMVAQHRMVSPDHLENVELSSYSISQITSIVLLVLGVLDIYF